MRQKVVVIGLWGCSGREDGGISGLCGHIRSTLEPLGVPGNNVFSMSWHPSRDNTNLSVAPDTDAHLDAINALTDTPGYVAIIEHSYGGWAACKLSRALAQRPNYIALIDAVFPQATDAYILMATSCKIGIKSDQIRLDSINGSMPGNGDGIVHFRWHMAHVHIDDDMSHCYYSISAK